MKTSELARATGVKVETILFYEKVGLLPPPARTQSNYRQYDQSHRARLLFIRRSRDLGFDIQSVRKMLSIVDDTSQSCGAIDTIAGRQLFEVEQKIRALSALKDELSKIIGQCKSGHVADCKIIEALSS